MERSIKAALEQGQSVEISTQFYYPSTSKRPKSYDYKVLINGSTKGYSFENVNKEE